MTWESSPDFGKTSQVSTLRMNRLLKKMILISFSLSPKIVRRKERSRRTSSKSLIWGANASSFSLWMPYFGMPRFRKHWNQLCYSKFFVEINIETNFAMVSYDNIPRSIWSNIDLCLVIANDHWNLIANLYFCVLRIFILISYPSPPNLYHFPLFFLKKYYLL